MSTRREEVTIQTLEGQIAATTTLKPSVRHDMRNYNTLPTPNASSEETVYTYSASLEEYYENEGTPGKNNIKTQPKPVNLDELNQNANDVLQKSQYEKYPSTTSRTMTSPTRLFSATSKYTTKATTTTTTQSITTPPTKLPLLRYFHTQNYTDSNT